MHILSKNQKREALSATENGRTKVIEAVEKMKDHDFGQIKDSNFKYHPKSCYSAYIQKA